MHVGVIGVNHKCAELKFRELFAKVCQKRFGPENSIHNTLSYVLLSTCNRTEFYFSSDDLPQTHSYFLYVLRQEIEEEFEHKLYCYFGKDCFLHLATVTAGLDSAVVFETEIQGQVKQAYELACTRNISSVLHFLFQKSLKIGKQIRSQFQSTGFFSTLEETIFKLFNDFFYQSFEKKVLFVGASEINLKIFDFFQKKGLKNSTFCNRHLQRLEKLFPDKMVDFLPWEELIQWSSFDCLIFATKCSEYLIYKAESLKKQILIMDLSVPRNVHPQLARSPFITLLNIDLIHRIVQRKNTLKASKLSFIEKEYLKICVEKQSELFLSKESRKEAFFKGLV